MTIFDDADADADDGDVHVDAHEEGFANGVDEWLDAMEAMEEENGWCGAS